MDTSAVDPMQAPEMGVKRIGTRQYVARNDRGATLRIGMGKGEWSPGELLKMALLGCNALVADARLAAVLGEDFAMEGTVDGNYLDDEDRYESFSLELNPQIDVDLSPAERQQMIDRTRRAINLLCTIGHTITKGATFDLTIDGERESQ